MTTLLRSFILAIAAIGSIMVALPASAQGWGGGGWDRGWDGPGWGHHRHHHRHWDRPRCWVETRRVWVETRWGMQPRTREVRVCR